MELQPDGIVRVWVNAPPVDGAANDAVRSLIAKTVGVSRSSVQLLRGERGRDKIFRISGLDLAIALKSISGGQF